MRDVQGIQFQAGSNEELLPGFSAEFPYLATRAEIHRYEHRFVPWHWHPAVELFYLERGVLEYATPRQRRVFPAGWGGFVNANVLHTTRPQPENARVVQLLHLFDPALVAGEPEGRIARRYVRPLVSSSLELLALDPGQPEQAQALALLREAFRLDEGAPGYELRLRAALSQVWLALFAQAEPAITSGPRRDPEDERLRLMMAYLYEHYPERIRVSELAAAAYLSERECYRVFREMLHTTPAGYLQRYRIEQACRMLRDTRETVSAIGYACGLGSGSYFGRVFRAATGDTPLAYRAKWQDSAAFGQERD